MVGRMSVEEVLARVDDWRTLAKRRLAGFRSASGVDGRGAFVAGRIIPLSEKLVAAGFAVMIETSGERFIGSLPRK